MNLLGGGIAAIVADASDFLMQDAVLHKPGAARYEGEHLVDGEAVDHPARGFLDTYSDLDRASGIPSDRRKVVLIAEGLPTPDIRDSVSIGGRTYTVATVDIDPAGATYTLGVA